MESTSSHLIERTPKLGLAIALAWAYLSAIFLLGEYRLPFTFGFGSWLLSTAALYVAGNLLARWATRRQWVSTSNLTNWCLSGVVTVCGLVALDTSYSIYLNSIDTDFDASKARVFDESVWVGELYPRVYWPTERNFSLHKPNVTVSGQPFGNFYSGAMRHSPTLVKSVLERHPVTIRINELGFRESSDISAAEIFTLGDSFTFGWGVNEEESWVGLLEGRLGKDVYNLGVHDSSPKQELELLKYVLKQQGEKVHIGTLLWMFYEGNDLEDDYTETVQRLDVPVPSPLTEGTLIEAAKNFMSTIRKQSVVDRWRRGEIRLGAPTKTGESSNPYSVDGVALDYPLYYSEKFGPSLFSSTQVALAGEPASYVESHWNREALESVILEMRALAEEHHFNVAVITVPTAARLHGRSFTNFPEISDRPYFLDFVLELSRSAGFATVDLYEALQPYAETEFLYFRDDDHFNPRGNALAADFIQQKLFTHTH